MATLPAWLYTHVNGSVQSKECTDIATYTRLKKDGWVDTPAGMSEDFPLPGAARTPVNNEAVEDEAAEVVQPPAGTPGETPVDILTLSVAAAKTTLATVTTISLLKAIRDREQTNPKATGGRKGVLDAIHARIADLV